MPLIGQVNRPGGQILESDSAFGKIVISLVKLTGQTSIPIAMLHHTTNPNSTFGHDGIAYIAEEREDSIGRIEKLNEIVIRSENLT